MYLIGFPDFSGGSAASLFGSVLMRLEQFAQMSDVVIIISVKISVSSRIFCLTRNELNV